MKKYISYELLRDYKGRVVGRTGLRGELYRIPGNQTEWVQVIGSKPVALIESKNIVRFLIPTRDW